MKNWRPITLLCVDYKIAAKVLPFIIHSDQSCGVPGRNPSENCRLLKDVVTDSNKNNIGGAVLSLDQEKAFDPVEWSYLQRVLQQMNFGESFRQWVSLLYCDIFSSVWRVSRRASRLSLVTPVVRGDGRDHCLRRPPK